MKRFLFTLCLAATTMSLLGCANENKENVTTKADSEKILESTTITGTFENVMGYSGEYFFETQNHQMIGYYKSGDETIAMVFGTNPEDVLIMDLDGDGENELISQLVWGDGAEDVVVFKKIEGQIKAAYCSDLLDEEYDNLHYMSCVTTLVQGKSQVKIEYWKEAEQKYYEKVYDIEIDKLNFEEPVFE